MKFGQTPKVKVPGLALHPESARDIRRKILKGASGKGVLGTKKPVQTDINLNLALSRGGEAQIKLAGPNLSYDELNKLEADLSGLGAGRTAGTTPERLVAAWLVQHNYRYGGMGYNYNGGEWGFQVPLLGGRYGGDNGSVADIFLNAEASGTQQGMAIRVNGAYFHMRVDNAAKDESKRLAMIAAGYDVKDIWDYEVLMPGTLDQKMREFLPQGYKL